MHKEKMNRKQAKKLIEECMFINSGDEATRRDTPRVALAKKVGRDIMMVKAEAQLDLWMLWGQ